MDLFFFISETESESHYSMESMPKTRNAADVMEKEKYFASESSLCCYHVNDAALKRRPLTAMMYKCTQGRVFSGNSASTRFAYEKDWRKKDQHNLKVYRKLEYETEKKYTEKNSKHK